MTRRWGYGVGMFVAVAVVGSWLGAEGWGQAPAQPTPSPEKAAAGEVLGQLPLPEGVVQAWEAAGLKLGWMRVTEWGPEFVSGKRDRRLGGVWALPVYHVPAFRVYRWQEGMLARLPAPGRAFGLDLSFTAVTDAGLKELVKLQKLQVLNLSLCKNVTDNGLKELAELKGLQVLDLRLTAVTDVGLKELARSKELQVLYLTKCEGVTDVGLKKLAGLQGLQWLDLSECKGVTDAGLKELTELEGLQKLYLGNARV